MKFLTLFSLALLIICSNVFAQKEQKIDKKEMKVKMIMEKDGNSTNIDTTIQINSKEDVQALLKSMGIDEEINIDIDFDDSSNDNKEVKKMIFIDKNGEESIIKEEIEIINDGEKETSKNRWVKDPKSMKKVMSFDEPSVLESKTINNKYSKKSPKELNIMSKNVKIEMEDNNMNFTVVLGLDNEKDALLQVISEDGLLISTETLLSKNKKVSKTFIERPTQADFYLRLSQGNSAKIWKVTQ